MCDLDNHLRYRPFMPPSPGFEQRIILAGYRQPQLARLTPFAWLRKTLEEYRLPTPQLTFALMLLVGLAIGFGAPPMGTYGTSAVETYLNDDGAVL